MPELWRVRIVGIGLEYPARRPAIQRYEPGSEAEFGPSTGHGTDLAPIPAPLMQELDRAQTSPRERGGGTLLELGLIGAGSISARLWSIHGIHG
jgi:hypothetical protein